MLGSVSMARVLHGLALFAQIQCSRARPSSMFCLGERFKMRDCLGSTHPPVRAPLLVLRRSTTDMQADKLPHRLVYLHATNAGCFHNVLFLNSPRWRSTRVLVVCNFLHQNCLPLS